MTTDATVTIKVDGRPYTLRVDEVCAIDAAALRRATGMSLRSLIEASNADPDIDVIAALVWLARRQTGEPNLTFDDAARSISYRSDFDLGQEADDDPLAETVDG